jgi:hypothetical protein
MEYSANESSDPTAPHSVRLEVVANLCASSSCPTVYRTSNNTLVVQGYAVRPEDVGVAVPDGELLVEIPLELLAEAARNTA